MNIYFLDLSDETRPDTGHGQATSRRASEDPDQGFSKVKIADLLSPSINSTNI